MSEHFLLSSGHLSLSASSLRSTGLKPRLCHFQTYPRDSAWLRPCRVTSLSTTSSLLCTTPSCFLRYLGDWRETRFISQISRTAFGLWFLAITCQISREPCIKMDKFTTCKLFHTQRFSSGAQCSFIRTTISTGLLAFVMFLIPSAQDTFKTTFIVPNIMLMNIMACYVFRKTKFGIFPENGISTISVSQTLPLTFERTALTST